MAIAARTLTDEDIQRQVVNELKSDAGLEAREIGVAVREGLVTLTGRVDRFGRRWVAGRAVLRVRGVKAVANALAWNTQVPHDAVQVSAWSAPGVTRVDNHITVRL